MNGIGRYVGAPVEYVLVYTLNRHTQVYTSALDCFRGGHKNRAESEREGGVRVMVTDSQCGRHDGFGDMPMPSDYHWPSTSHVWTALL